MGRSFRVAHFEAPGRKYEAVDDSSVVQLDRCEVELGACLWHDAVDAVLRFLENHRGSYASVRVLELGAGAGACGIGLAFDGADVVLTDVGGLVPLLELNIATNSLAFTNTS